MNSSIVDLGNVQIRTLETQFSDKPQLVCIHGGMGLGSDSLIQGLGTLRDIFDLLFIDLRGCGQSTASKDGSYALSDFSSDIQKILSKSPIRERGVFGHSLGGMIAIELLSAFPDVASFAVLSNSAANDGWRDSAREAVSRIQSPELTEAITNFNSSPNDDLLARELAIEYGPIYFPELSRKQAKVAMAQFSYRADAQVYTNQHVYPGMDISKQASALNCPILIIGGEIDGVLPVKCQEELHSLIKDSELKVIKRAGHFPFQTQPEEFKSVVSHWFNSVSKEIV